MDYTFLQGFGLDAQLMEQRNLSSLVSANGFSQRPAHISTFPPISLPIPEPPDPLLLQTKHAWFNRVQIPPAGNLGVDSSGHSFPHQRSNMQNSHINARADMTTAAISSDSFYFRDVSPDAQCRQICSLSSDEYLSDSTLQEHCLYTSSSDCAHDARSSGSSERRRPSSRSGWVGSPSDETNWWISDVLQPKLGKYWTAGFPTEALPTDSSLIAADLDKLDSSRRTLRSLVSMPGPEGECIPFKTSVSEMFTRRIGWDTGPIVTNLLNGQHVPNMAPLGSFVCTQSNNHAPPYKRQRTSYKVANSSASTSLSSSSTKSSASEYPIAPPLNITDALNKYICVSKRQTTFLPKPTVIEAEGPVMNRAQFDNGLKYHRKDNATSIEPQSVAARDRRRKISERIRVLEKLIPGGNKMDTASMLDESIEYVKFLQLQVHLLESQGDILYGSSAVKATPSLCNNPIGREEDGLDLRKFDCFGSQASESCTMQMVRPGTPLVLSEVLQQQLFKQKMCLVSLRQCCPNTPSSTSGSYA